jgi:hypothetical protein
MASIYKEDTPCPPHSLFLYELLRTEKSRSLRSFKRIWG